MPQYRCPYCHAEIAIDDVNVVLDIAHCRSCGKAVALSLIAGVSEISTELPETPPKELKAQWDVAGDLVLVYRKRSPLLIFLVPFTIAWSGMSIFGLYGSQISEGKFDLVRTLFGLPFLLGTVALLAAIAFMLFGKWVIALKGGALSVFIGVGPIGWTRRFAYDRETLVSLRQTSFRVNDIPQKGVAVNTGGKDFIFGASLREDVKRYIAAAIAKQLPRK